MTQTNIADLLSILGPFVVSQTATTMGECVLNDVVEDILGHLPVKSVTRFRCVSKSWDSIITDPTFITKHFKLNLNQSESLTSTNTHSGHLLYTSKDENSSPSSKHLCTVVCNSDSTLTQISRFEIPSLFEKYSIVGFCNGLFCLASRDYDLSHIIYLWNPSIRMFKKLLATPLTSENKKIYTMSVVGLAYNFQNNDFKILRLLSVLWGEAEAEIYSLSTDSWRKVEISMKSLRGNEQNFGRIRFGDIDPPFIFFNGALHTVAMANCHRFILSYDVNDESFREIMLPFNYSDVVTKYQLALFKGSLAVFALADSLMGDLCDIWVMEEYGVADSWTRKCTVPMIRGRDVFYGCTDNGELLIKNATGLISFDPENQKQNILAIEDADWVGFTANSMESLILLDGSRDVNFYGRTDNGELWIKNATGLIPLDPENQNQDIPAIEDADWAANSMESFDFTRWGVEQGRWFDSNGGHSVSWICRNLILTLRHVDNDGNEEMKIDEEANKGLCELLDKEIAINETNNIIDVSKVETLTQIYFLL